MFDELELDEWSEAGVSDESYVLLATDISTINRIALSCEDRAWALEITAQRLQSFGHCVVATRRNAHDDGWLALCENGADD